MAFMEDTDGTDTFLVQQNISESIVTVSVALFIFSNFYGSSQIIRMLN